MTQQQPARLIDVLAENTRAENLDCHACEGHGSVRVFDAETGSDDVDCDACQGSGYNQLGMIMQGLLSPPEEGYGPTRLREALRQAETQPPRKFKRRLQGLERTPRVAGRLDLLADRRYNLLRRKERIQKELDYIDDEMKDRMLEGEIAYGSSGVGYRLSVTRQDVYDRDVIRELENLGLLPWFCKVSTTRLKELARKGLLSWEQFHALQAMARGKEIPALREITHPEARVI